MARTTHSCCGAGCSQSSATLDFVVTERELGIELDELLEGRGVEVVLDVRSFLGENRAVQVG